MVAGLVCDNAVVPAAAVATVGVVAGFACIDAVDGSGFPAAAVVDAATVGESVFGDVGAVVVDCVNPVVPAACG